MPDPVSAIPNLGAAAVTLYARAGIASAEEVRALGADATYSRLLASGQRPHFIAFYALAMGLQGRRWTDITGAEKAALRSRFDALCREAARQAKGRPGEEAAPDSLLEAALDALGVIRPQPAARPTGSSQPTSSRPEKK